jgi:peptidoglycan/LPS O-acetylase OafA/YrhL
VALWSATDSPATQFCFRRVDSRFDAPFWFSIPTFTFNWLRILRSNIVGGWGLHWDILWSLAIEEQFYLFYPLLVLLLRPRWSWSRVLLRCSWSAAPLTCSCCSAA